MKRTLSHTVDSALVVLGCVLVVGAEARSASRVPLVATTVSEQLRPIAARPAAADAYARLLRVLPALDALSPSQQQAALKRILRASQRSAPRMAARVRFELMRFSTTEAARSDARKLGFMTDWAAAGPFPAPPSDPLSPHLELLGAVTPTLGTETPGLGGVVTWRRHRDHGPPAGTGFGHLLRREELAAAHLVTVVDVPRRTRATLTLGAAGAVAVSLDGKVLGVRRALAFGAPDQLEADVTLSAGRHVLAVTIVHHAMGRNTLYARFVDGRGKALPLLHGPPTARDRWPSTARATRDKAPRLSDGSALRAVRGRPLMAAIVRRSLGLPDLSGVGASAALLEDLMLTREASQLPPEQLLLALLHVPRAEARASILLHLRANGRGGAGVSGDGPLVVALADLAAEKGQVVRAEGLLADARGAVTTPHRAHRLVTARALRGDSPARAWRILDAGLRGTGPPVSERWLREAAAVAADIGRHDRAAALWRRLAAATPSDVEVRAAHAQALVSIGQPGQAIAALEGAGQARPDLAGYQLEAARLALDSGRLPAARSLAAGLEASVGFLDADALEALGRLFERLDAPQRALAAYNHALKRRPTSPELRAAVERLDPRRRRALPFTVRYDEAMAGRPSRASKALFEVLSEEVHLDVHADGGFTKHSQRFVRVHEVPGDREARTSFLRFDPSQEAVRIIAANVHRNGLTLPVLQRDIVQVSEAWYGLYYDQRELGVPFDDLEPGDVIEISYRSESIVAPALKGAFDWIELIQERHYKHRALMTVTTPPALDLQTRLNVPAALATAGVSSVQRRKTLADGRLERSWLVTDIPALDTEPLMPGGAEVALLWQASTHKSWVELARRYQRLVDPQRIVTPAMRRWLARKKARAKSRRALTEAIVEGITKEIRYVGLEFGIHGYKPYRTDQVWVRRFGDCKDQATLMTTLLGEVGITGQVVLVRTRKHGRMPDALPALALFDHAIVYLPELDLYVDPTVRTYGLGELPGEDQGTQVLVLGETDLKKPLFRRTPPSDPTATGISGTYSIHLNGSGRARVKGEVKVSGSMAPRYREKLAPRDTREQRLEKILNVRYPGFALEAFDVSDPTDLKAPLTITFQGEAPQLATRAGAALHVTSPAGGTGFLARLASDSKRSHALVVGPPATHRFSFTYRHPLGYALSELPASRTGTSRFGTFRVTWKATEQGASAKTELTLRQDQVSPADYPAFRAFLRSFDEAVRPPLVIAMVAAQ